MFLKSIYARIVIFMALICTASGLWLESFVEIFQQSPALNAVILGTMVFGILVFLKQFLQFFPELKWLAVAAKQGSNKLKKPCLLRNLMEKLQQSKGKISSDERNYLVQALEARLVEQREVGRYLVGVSVFLGLLGTFWGLSQTLQSVSKVVMTMPTETSIGTQFLMQLKQGLSSPLAGMGIAFSSSLFGLLGSLILGFLEMQVNQARFRFLTYVEQWIKANTSIALSSQSMAQTQEAFSMMQAILGQSVESLERLQESVVTTRDQQQYLNTALVRLSEQMDRLVDQRFTEHNVMLKLAEGIVALQTTTTDFQKAIESNRFGVDETTAHHIRNLDHATYRLVDAITQGQASLARELRNEIRILSRTMASIAEVELTEEKPLFSKEGTRKKTA